MPAYEVNVALAFLKMIQIKARLAVSAHPRGMWKPILSAPFGRDLELAVLDEDGEHALVFPCVRGTGRLEERRDRRTH